MSQTSPQQHEKTPPPASGALVKAVTLNDTPEVERLLQAGSNINETFGKDGRTALIQAVWNSSLNIKAWRQAGGMTFHMQPFRAAQHALGGTEHGNQVAIVLEGHRHRFRHVGQQPHNRAARRGEDALAIGVVVEADIARDDGDAHRPAGIGEASNRFGELPHHFRFLWVAEVEAIGQAQWLFNLYQDVDLNYMERRIREETDGEYGVQDLEERP